MKNNKLILYEHGYYHFPTGRVCLVCAWPLTNGHSEVMTVKSGLFPYAITDKYQNARIKLMLRFLKYTSRVQLNIRNGRFVRKDSLNLIKSWPFPLVQILNYFLKRNNAGI